MNGRVVGGCWERGGRELGGCWEGGGRVLGRWWEGGGRVLGRWWAGAGRIVGGVGFAVGLLSLQGGSQGPACIASEKSGLFSSCEGPIRIPLESLPGNSQIVAKVLEFQLQSFQ